MPLRSWAQACEEFAWTWTDARYVVGLAPCTAKKRFVMRFQEVTVILKGI